MSLRSDISLQSDLSLRSDMSLRSDLSLQNDTSQPPTTKKMIKPDVTAISQLLNFDEEEEDTSDSEEMGGDKEEEKDLSDSDEGREDKQQGTDSKKTGERHSMTTPESSSLGTTPESSGLVTTPESPEGGGQERIGLQDKQTLCLNLAEVKHIRSVITKAELEGLPPAVSLGKICFSCIKTKFSLFSRGQSCDICTQLVCGQCASKMRIPVEQFSQTPVLVLSPAHHPTTPLAQLGVSDLQQNTAGSASTSPCSPRREEAEEEVEEYEEDDESPPSSLPPPELLRIHTVSGQLENNEEEDVETLSEEGGPTSLPVGMDNYSTPTRKTCRRWSMVSNRSSREQREQIEGSLLTVCTDCKQMVQQVIRTTRSQRKSQPSRQSSVFFSHLSQPGNGGGTEQRY